MNLRDVKKKLMIAKVGDHHTLPELEALFYLKMLEEMESGGVESNLPEDLLHKLEELEGKLDNTLSKIDSLESTLEDLDRTLSGEINSVNEKFDNNFDSLTLKLLELENRVKTLEVLIVEY